MAIELDYVLITPYSLLKSRTGGIISRLLARSGLDLVGARLYAPSDGFVDEYREIIARQDIDPELKRGLLEYLDDYVRKDNRLGITNRTLLLLFEGEDAIANLKRNVGSLSGPQAQGDTVRGTYGEFVRHFEPAVFVGTDESVIADELRLFARHARSDGGILEDVVSFPDAEEPAETTLVILKPDNFKPGSSRPGNIIDMFSRTGLCIVGARMLRMSVAQAEEFYAPLRPMFVDRLRKGVAERARAVLKEAFDFPITDEMVQGTTELLKEANARHEFYRIVHYMSGRDPYTVTDPEEKAAPGEEKCLALLYRGPGAIRKIRECLGSTNPAEAAPGTVRSVYGNDLMKNGAHASDSPENAERERRIVGLWEETGPSDLEVVIENYLSKP
jgi:nucleoside diphosphate kinase